MEFSDWARAVAALGATLALLGLAAYGARRLGMAQGGPAAAKRRMQLVESLMLDPRRRLVLVRLDGHEHLVLISPFGDRRIASQPAPAEPAPPPVVPAADTPPEPGL